MSSASLCESSEENTEFTRRIVSVPTFHCASYSNLFLSILLPNPINIFRYIIIITDNNHYLYDLLHIIKIFKIALKMPKIKETSVPILNYLLCLFLGFFFTFKPIKIFSWGSSTAICQLWPKGSSALMLMFAEEK